MLGEKVLKQAMRKISKALIAVIIAAMGLTGCLRVSADELYSLPQMSEEYLKLQAQLNAVLRQGAEFSPPTGGPNRQAVQLRDIDGCGRNEVLAFFSFPAESAMKIYILEINAGDYAVVEIIEGGGNAIESVRYVDMDGDGIMEIIVGWQMGTALKYFSIYTLKDFRSVLLAREEYTELAVFDLTGDGNEDIIALRLPTQDTGAVAQMFALMPDGEIVSETARLSNGVEAISRVLPGRLIDDVPAIFVECEGRFDDMSLVTDICAFRDGSFTNILVKGPGGVSEETVRARIYSPDRIYSSDIDKDGIIKVPIPRLLMAQSETPYYAIDWYAFNSLGYSRLLLTTYHNYFDEWFLILPNDWSGKVSVRREDTVSGERTVIFSYIADESEPYEDFLKIYRLTGDFGEERARLPGRILLMSEGTSTYAFELLAPPNSYGLTFDESIIRANFRLIYSAWLAGTI